MSRSPRLGHAAALGAATLLAACGGAPRPTAREATPPAPREEAAARPAPDGESALSARIGELFERGMQAGDEAALAEAFREMRAVARPEELPVVDRVERLARDMRAAGDDVDALLRIMVAALSDLERLSPDLESRLAVARQAFALSETAAGEPAGVEADRLALGASERLVRDRPDDPRAWSLRAHVLRRVAEDLRGALVAARRCSATLPPCAALAWQLVREIEAPRCPAASLRPGFALHRGTRDGAHERATRALSVGGVTMWVAEVPALTLADVASIAGDGTTAVVELTPAAASRIEAFRVQVAGVDTEGAILVEGRPAARVSRLVPMMRGKLLLGTDPSAPLALETLCTQIVRDRAPD